MHMHMIAQARTRSQTRTYIHTYARARTHAHAHTHTPTHQHAHALFKDLNPAFANLIELGLNFTNITGNFNSIKKNSIAPRMTHLGLQATKVTGTVCQVVAFAPNIEVLNLNHTDIEGPLPEGSGCDELRVARLTNSRVEAEQRQKEAFLREFRTCKSLEINVTPTYPVEPAYTWNTVPKTTTGFTRGWINKSINI